MSRTREEYVRLAEEAILDLIDKEHAAVRPEIEWRIADRQWRTAPCPIDPHHITTALQRLAGQERLKKVTARTRGGRAISVLQAGTTTGRTRRMEAATARKRLLHTRYLSWATGTGAGSSGRGVIGAAGEAVVHASLLSSNGYTLAQPAGGDVRTFLGGEVEGGSLDNAAFLLAFDTSTRMMQDTFAVPIEVKNVQQWIYPDSKLLHQLLYKASLLQQRNTDVNLVPVLVCRRAHYLTNVMAQDLGFYVISTKRQYIRPLITATEEGRRAFQEVCDELGYWLEPHENAVPEMITHFAETLPSVAKRSAVNWGGIGSQYNDIYRDLRRDDINHERRRYLFGELAFQTGMATGESMRWHRDDTADRILDDDEDNGTV
jgi:hypothetical protein